MTTTRLATRDEQDAHLEIMRLDERIAELKAQRDEITAPIRERMDAEGISALTRNGKRLFRLDEVQRTTLDKDGLDADHPGLLAKYQSLAIGTRFVVGRVARVAERVAA